MTDLDVKVKTKTVIKEDTSKHDAAPSKVTSDISPEVTKTKEDEKRQNEKPIKRQRRKLSLTETENFNEKLRRRGVLYFSRIPPRMGPAKMKSLMTDFGVVTRVYLVEEDKTVRKRRLRALGKSKSSGGKRYTEGWVEMECKKVAKRIAMALNNTPITNQKRNVHYGDMWNIKYLKKFQWSHLTEKVAYERRIREQKMRLEMMQARKENHEYSTLVEAGKSLDKIQQRREKRKAKEEADVGEKRSPIQRKKMSSINNQQFTPRKFRQTEPLNDDSHHDKSLLMSSFV